jgi:hypothetical protein
MSGSGCSSGRVGAERTSDESAYGSRHRHPDIKATGGEGWLRFPHTDGEEDCPECLIGRLRGWSRMSL